LTTLLGKGEAGAVGRFAPPLTAGATTTAGSQGPRLRDSTVFPPEML